MHKGDEKKEISRTILLKGGALGGGMSKIGNIS